MPGLEAYYDKYIIKPVRQNITRCQGNQHYYYYTRAYDTRAILLITLAHIIIQTNRTAFECLKHYQQLFNRNSLQKQ